MTSPVSWTSSSNVAAAGANVELVAAKPNLTPVITHLAFTARTSAILEPVTIRFNDGSTNLDIVVWPPQAAPSQDNTLFVSSLVLSNVEIRGRPNDKVMVNMPASYNAKTNAFFVHVIHTKVATNKI